MEEVGLSFEEELKIGDSQKRTMLSVILVIACLVVGGMLIYSIMQGSSKDVAMNGSRVYFSLPSDWLTIVNKDSTLGLKAKNIKNSTIVVQSSSDNLPFDDLGLSMYNIIKDDSKYYGLSEKMKTTVNGLKAVRFEYKNYEDNMEVSNALVYIDGDVEDYVIMSRYPTKASDKDKEKVENIIKSFKER